MGTRSVPRTEHMSRVRFMILAMLFIAMAINYADRATISIVGSAMQKELGINAASLGYIFSALRDRADPGRLAAGAFRLLAGVYVQHPVLA